MLLSSHVYKKYIWEESFDELIWNIFLITLLTQLAMHFECFMVILKRRDKEEEDLFYFIRYVNFLMTCYSSS